MMKRKFSYLIVFTIVLALLMGCASNAKLDESTTAVTDVKIYDSFTSNIYEIQKYGNLTLTLKSSELIEAGYEHGDFLEVKIGDEVLSVPLCTDYSDVNVGELVLRDKDGRLVLAINMGDFATTYLGASKTTNPDKSFIWDLPKGVTLEGIPINLSMGEKAGYKDEYLIHQLERTNNREDYASDEIFANARPINGGKLGKNALFRSSSPVNNELNRAKYSDAFIAENGVRCVMNLADSTENIQGYFTQEDFSSPYYKSLFEEGCVKPLNLGVDFKADDFKKGLKEGLLFFSTHEGPYLVHCTEGKDRAGFVSALLSALMDVSYDNIVKDYMETYKNYYHLEEGSEQYNAVKNSNIVTILSLITGEEKDLQKGAEAYIKALGLTGTELKALKSNLAKDH